LPACREGASCGTTQVACGIHPGGPHGSIASPVDPGSELSIRHRKHRCRLGLRRSPPRRDRGPPLHRIHWHMQGRQRRRRDCRQCRQRHLCASTWRMAGSATCSVGTRATKRRACADAVPPQLARCTCLWPAVAPLARARSSTGPASPLPHPRLRARIHLHRAVLRAGRRAVNSPRRNSGTRAPWPPRSDSCLIGRPRQPWSAWIVGRSSSLPTAGSSSIMARTRAPSRRSQDTADSAM
jgi:hypothetical protein